MVRDNIVEELEHLEEIAISLGHLRNESLSLPPTIEDVSSWIHDLETLVFNTDQLDLQATLTSGRNTLGTLTRDNCASQLRGYAELIEQMRNRLYQLKTINRSAQSGQPEMIVGSYRLSPSGRILFRDNEITFGGKLKVLLVAFLTNNTDNTLTTEEIANLWGDGNIAATSKRKCKLETALTPYYGDGHKHINRVQMSPLTYKLDTE